MKSLIGQLGDFKASRKMSLNIVNLLSLSARRAAPTKAV